MTLVESTKFCRDFRSDLGSTKIRGIPVIVYSSNMTGQWPESAVGQWRNLGSETPSLLEPDRYRMAIPMMRAKATYAATITSTSGTKRSAASTRPMSIPVTSPISRTQSA